MAECFILPGDIDSGGECTEGGRFVLAACFGHSERLVDVLKCISMGEPCRLTISIDVGRACVIPDGPWYLLD